MSNKETLAEILEVLRSILLLLESSAPDHKLLKYKRAKDADSNRNKK